MAFVLIFCLYALFVFCHFLVKQAIIWCLRFYGHKIKTQIELEEIDRVLRESFSKNDKILDLNSEDNVAIRIDDIEEKKRLAIEKNKHEKLEKFKNVEQYTISTFTEYGFTEEELAFLLERVNLFLLEEAVLEEPSDFIKKEGQKKNWLNRT